MRQWVIASLAFGCTDPTHAESPRPTAPPASVPSTSQATPRPTEAGRTTGGSALPEIDCSGWASDRDPVLDARSSPVRGAFRPTRLTTSTLVRALPGELFVVTLAGSVSVERGESRLRLSPWEVARARGGGVRVVPEGAACVVYALSTELATLETALASKITVDTSAPLDEVDLARAPELTWSGGRASARLGFEGPGAALSVLSMTDELEVAEHVHDESDEILVAIAGAKWLTRASGPGDVEVTTEKGVLLEPGSTAHVRAGVRHGAMRFAGTGGGERFFALQLYAPDGPEQRFKALAAEDARAAPR